MHLNRTSLATASLFIATTTSSLANYVLPEIIVTATRANTHYIDTAANIVTISHSEIEKSGAQNIVDLLRGKGGVHISDGGSSASIDMRGFGGAALSNVLILVDGRKLNTATDSSTLYLNSIDLELVKQIEIVQGSSGILYGNQAVGGMINIITHRADQQTSNASIETGSYSSQGLSASLSRQLENGLGYRIHAKKRRSDNYREHNQLDLNNFSLLLNQDYDSGSLFVEHQQMDENLQTPGALFADELATNRTQAIFNNDYIDTNNQVTRLGVDHSLHSNWRLLGEITHKVDDREFIQSFRTSAGTKSTQDRTTTTFNPRLSGILENPYGDTIITIGYDREQTDYQLVTSFGPQNNSQTIQALYSQLVYPLSAELTTTIGYRHAEVKNRITGTSSLNHDNRLSAASAAMSFTPSDEWRLFLRTDQNYRFAKVDEHTNPVFGQPVGLKDQTGTSYEVGAEFSTSQHFLSISGYRLELKNEIGFDSTGFSNINLDKTRRSGVSLAARMEQTPALSIGGNYDYIDSEVSSGPFQGNDIPLVPEHRARLFAEWNTSNRSSLTIEALHVGSQAIGSDYSNAFDRLSSFQLLNITAQRKLSNWRLSVKINNLLDKAYSETANVGYNSVWTPTPGYNTSPERNYMLTLSYDF